MPFGVDAAQRGRCRAFELSRPALAVVGTPRRDDRGHGERPGADADLGDFEEEVELAGVVGRYPYPGVSAEARLARGMGYVALAGLFRFIGWDALTGTGATSTRSVGA